VDSDRVTLSSELTALWEGQPEERRPPANRSTPLPCQTRTYPTGALRQAKSRAWPTEHAPHDWCQRGAVDNRARVAPPRADRCYLGRP
jgi:hypothetical protein